MILGLFQRLPESCREIVAAASVVGREFELSMLGEILDQERAAIERSLEGALANTLVEEITRKPGCYKFRHALVQDVVYEQISSLRRSDLHQRAGQALERRFAQDLEAHAGELAGHFDAAGPEYWEKVILYRRLAGERALRMNGFEDAYGQFRRALDLGKGKIHPLVTAQLLSQRGQSEHGLGRFADAAESHVEAFELLVKNGAIDKAVNVFEHTLISAERHPRATRILEEALSLIGPDSPRAQALDVLRLLSEGLSNAQIGERLFISLYTVANHVQSILQKTGAANRTEAAAYAVRHNLTVSPQ